MEIMDLEHEVSNGSEKLGLSCRYTNIWCEGLMQTFAGKARGVITISRNRDLARLRHVAASTGPEQAI